MPKYPTAVFLRKGFRYLHAATLIGCFACGGFVLGALEYLNGILPNAENLLAYRPQLATEIYSTEMQKDGSEQHTLLARVFQEDREPIELKDIPKDLINATVAIEDRRFYSHRGISPRDMARAAWIDLANKEAKQGASTITQQLARNIWLTREKSLDRKLKEAVLALELERKYSKDEIIEMYLNEVCYGHGAFGIKTAARMYYGKEPKDLKLHQIATLAGLPQRPRGHSPYRNPDNCKIRRNSVLIWMQREGYISAAQRKQASEMPLQDGLIPLKERKAITRYAPHFTQLMIRELSNEYGLDTVYGGGLRVFTTLDIRVQKAAEDTLTKGIERLRAQGEIKRGLQGQGALACVEAKTGRVLAMVGGVGPYEKVQYNRAYPGPPRYGRQPGSSMKPYVWATALENGYGPDSTFSADPISIDLGYGQKWTPKNYSARQRGNYSLRRALADSVNLVSVRVVQKLGVTRVQRMAARILSIDNERLRPVISMALGSSELSPLEQACGYSAFANAGLLPTKRMIRRIEDYDGQVIASYEPQVSRVFRQSTGISMISMLRTVVTSGTGSRAQACGKPCGGKTGTTNSGRDVWFVGFTPDLSCAIWIGNDDNSPMPNGSGGGFCAPIWAKFIRDASEILHCNGEFPEGTGAKSDRPDEAANSDGFVTVCTETGLRATPGCPGTRELAHKPGQRPPKFCTSHGGLTETTDKAGKEGGTVSMRVCASSGQLAGPNCPASRSRRFARGEEPSGICKMHSGGSEHEGGRTHDSDATDIHAEENDKGSSSGNDGDKSDATTVTPVTPMNIP